LPPDREQRQNNLPLSGPCFYHAGPGPSFIHLKEKTMQAYPIVQQFGPLPIQVKFTPPLDGDMLLVVTGSLWSQDSNVMLTLTAAVDGTTVGNVEVFSNGSSTHRVLPTLFANLSLTDGGHVLTLSATGSDVVSDSNDSFYAAILY
jgi:hypothetical protein